MNIGHKLLLIVATSVALVSIPSVMLGYFVSKDKILADEAVMLTNETNDILAKHNVFMEETASGLRNLSELIKKASDAPHQLDVDGAITRSVRRDSDQAWRSLASSGELAKSGIFIPPDTRRDASHENLYLHIKQLLDIYGPAITNPLTNIWFIAPDGADIVFDKLEDDIVHKIPADVNFPETPWVQLGDPEFNPERSLRWTYPIIDPASKNLVVSILLPLDIDGRWIGNIGHHFNLSPLLSTLFKSSQRYPHEQHFLLDNQNHYILAGPWYRKVEKSDLRFRPDLSREPELANLLGKPLNSQPKSFGRPVTMRGQEYLAVGVLLQPLGWRYFRLVPVDDILERTQKTYLYLTIMVIISGVLIGLLIDMAVRGSFVSRINKLAGVLRRYGNGDLKVRSNLPGGDEISDLAKDFDEMAEMLEHQLKVETNFLQREKTGMGVALDGICILDKGGGVKEANNTFCRMLGYTMDEMENLNISHWNTQWAINEIPDRIEDLIPQQTVFETVFRAKDGSLLDVEVSAAGMSLDGQMFLYCSSRDITDRKRAENQIKQLAYFDSLTNLPNRRLLLDRIKHALISGERNKTGCALLFIDLDRFKTLNDTLGHDQGDILLQLVAQRLTSCIRESDTAARLGGDEFVVLLEHLSGKNREAASRAKAVGEKILAALNNAYMLHEQEYHCSCSIGISLISGHESTVEELLKRADIAMYQAKLAGRNALKFFDPEMEAAVIARGLLEADLHNGIKERQFVLYYQPQVRKGGRDIYGAEVLVRWQHPKRGVVSPLNFIPVAEENGLILPLGQWVLENACTQLADWADRECFAEFTLSVNVSARQFLSRDFVDEVLTILDKTGANPRRLKLELTESVFAENPEEIISKMNALKSVGIEFSLDDFGTGYSSLSYLKQLPLDQLKIDQSFVMDVLTDNDDAAIANVIIMLAESLGLNVIAEGVETEGQLNFLRSQGCHHYQGYLFSGIRKKLWVDA